jgi:hypothetical protein
MLSGGTICVIDSIRLTQYLYHLHRFLLVSHRQLRRQCGSHRSVRVVSMRQRCPKKRFHSIPRKVLHDLPQRSLSAPDAPNPYESSQ